MNRWDYYMLRKMKEIFERRTLKKEKDNYAGRELLSLESGNERIAQLITDGRPMAVSRFGSTELSVILRREAHRNHRLYKNNDRNLCELSGFFPNDIALMDKFVTMVLEMVGDINLLACWFSSLEEYVVGEYMPNSELTRLVAVEPYAFDNPWSNALKGKKVLVVHPFEESILKQYARREKLFSNPDILPEFELKTLKAVQTIAGEKDVRFDTWFDAFDYMKNRMKEIDFDVAIIGCGAYGMPLAIEAKRMGKQAVHMGGATQLLFGIKGARWDNTMRHRYNEYWIRPGENEQCSNQSIVEGGCYW